MMSIKEKTSTCFAGALLILFALRPLNAPARTIQALSGSTADLQAAVNSAVSGDIVQIPAGTFSFSGSVSFNAGITLMGAGETQTVLAKSGTSTSPMLVVNGSNGQKVTIANMTLSGIDNATTSIMDKGLNLTNGCKDFRVHHVTFKRFGESAINVTGNSRGVIDHCKFLYIYRSTIGNYGYGVVVYGDGAASWSRALSLGTQDAVFVEDSYFIGNRHAIASNNGSRYVFRYNQVFDNAPTFQGIDAHGRGNGSSYGSRSYEIYNNTVDNAVACQTGVAIRGGDGVIFSNAMVRGTSYGIMLSNDSGSSSYPMPDQIRSLYLWNNTHKGNATCATVKDGFTSIIQQNRDYFCSQKSGYAPYTYPHPLTGGTAPSDTTAPAVSAFAIPATATSLNVPITSLTATDNVGVTGYMLTESATAPAASAAGWSASAPASYTFASAGNKTLYAWAKDAAGNVSASRSAAVTITLPPTDTTAPSVPTGLSLSNATQSGFTLNWSASTDNVGVAGYRLDVSLNSAFSSFITGYNNKDLGNVTSASITGLSAGTAYYARLRAYDAAGNNSANSAAASATTQSQSSSTYDLPSDRKVAWQGNVGVLGDIPHRTNVCSTLNPLSGNNASAIQTAINNCPAGQVVKLNAGTFSISSPITVKSGVTLRGAGMGSTIIRGAAGMTGSYVMGMSAGYSRGTSVSIAGGLTKGSTNIITSSAHGWNAGDIILIDQLNNASDNPPVTNTGESGTCTWCGRSSGTRSLGQMARIVAVPNSTTATLEIPLYWNYDASLSPQGTKFNGITKDAGIEDLTIDNGLSGNANQADSGGTIVLSGTSNCWLLNVEGIDLWQTMLRVAAAYRNTIRNSKFHEVISPGSSKYGMWLNPYTSANLFENNQIYNVGSGVLLNGATSGNVFAYNYIVNLHDPTASNWNKSAFAFHGSHPIMNLIEGNFHQGRLTADNVWGSSSHNTFFRNRSALSPNKTGAPWDFDFQTNSRYLNVVGNVAGTPGFENTYELNNVTLSGQPAIYRLGYQGGGDGSFSLRKDEGGVVLLHDGNASLDSFVGKKVKVVGQYSGSTLYVDVVEVAE